MEVAGDTGNSQRLFKFSRDTDGRWILVRESSCSWNGKSIHDSQQGLHCWPTYFKKEFTWLYANVVSLTTTATSCLLTLTELTIVLVIRLLKWGRPFPTKFSPPHNFFSNWMERPCWNHSFLCDIYNEVRIPLSRGELLSVLVFKKGTRIVYANHLAVILTPEVSRLFTWIMLRRLT